MDDLPVERAQEIAESVVGERRSVRVIVEVAPGFEPEVRLNGNQATAAARKHPARLEEDWRRLFEREVLEKVRREYRAETSRFQRQSISRGLD